MPDMLHQIRIAASAAQVYETLTTAEGLKSWWTGDVVAEPRQGTVAEFGFSNRSTLFLMRIEELEPGQCVVWSCEGESAEWKGTRLVFELAETQGGTDLRFTHAGWASMGGTFAVCNSTWGALMFRLRDACEGKAPGPLFKGIV